MVFILKLAQIKKVTFIEAANIKQWSIGIFSVPENGQYKMKQFDLNGNQYDVDQYDNVSSYCQYKKTEPEEIIFPMSDDGSYRVSRPLVTATTATKRASTGVRITLPAINVKVSTSRTKGTRLDEVSYFHLMVIKCILTRDHESAFMS